MASKPPHLVTMKVAFLLALATAKRVGKLQALSCQVASHGPGISLAYLPEFVAKTESKKNPLPRSFLVQSLEEFVGDLPEERVVCLVRAVRAYLSITASISPRPRLLLVSLKRPSRALLKNTLSFFLRQVILDTGAMEQGSLPPDAHSIQAVATLAAFLRNWSVSKVLEAATWRSNPVFHSFYFCDICICWILVTLWGPLSRGIRFYLGHSFVFSFVFRIFHYRVRGLVCC